MTRRIEVAIVERSVRSLHDMLRIDRCCCTQHFFDELKAIADDRGLSFGDLQREVGCGLSCGLCVPYIKAMLKTGTTVFHEVLVEGQEAAPRRSAPRARAERT